MGWYGLAHRRGAGHRSVSGRLSRGISSAGELSFCCPPSSWAQLLSWADALFSDVLETSKKKFDFFLILSRVFSLCGAFTLGLGNVSSYGITAPSASPPLARRSADRRDLYPASAAPQRTFFRAANIEEKNSPPSALSVVCSSTLVMMGSSVLMPLYVQSVRGYSATTSALVVLPGSLAMALTSPFAGKLSDKIGMKKLFVAGSATGLLSEQYRHVYSPRWKRQSGSPQL